MWCSARLLCTKWLGDHFWQCSCLAKSGPHISLTEDQIWQEGGGAEFSNQNWSWGPFLATKTGPGDHLLQPKLVPRDNFWVGPVLLWQKHWWKEGKGMVHNIVYSWAGGPQKSWGNQIGCVYGTGMHVLSTGTILYMAWVWQGFAKGLGARRYTWLSWECFSLVPKPIYEWGPGKCCMHMH